MQFKKVNILTLLLLYITLNFINAFASLHVDIGHGSFQKTNIALLGFKADNINIAQVIGDDLQHSGLFALNDNIPENNLTIDDIPSLDKWKRTGITGILIGAVSYDSSNDKLLVKYRLWDVISQKQLIGKSITATTKDWRRTAHIIADAIYEIFIGDPGYFDTRITYIAESGPMINKTKRVAIMDQDGQNHTYLTDGKNIVVNPRFSPDNKNLAYIIYGDKGATVYLQNLTTGDVNSIGSIKGIASAINFSPDGKYLIMALSDKGATNVYNVNLNNFRKKRLTNSSRSINTSPSYSPDQKHIVFNSDRSGISQLYVMNAEGGSLRRISFGKGSYMTPSWSPRGDYIAFIKILKNKFYLGIIRPDGTGERLLTGGYLVDNPSWSANGRVIMFEKQTKIGSRRLSSKTGIHTIDITGINENILPIPQEGIDPAWSPLL